MPVVAAYDVRYYVGEYPTDSLSIRIVDYAGEPYTLMAYDSALLYTDPALPDGVTTIFDVDNAIVRHTWSGPFETVGRFMAQVHLIDGPYIDYAPPMAIEVVAPNTPNPYWSTDR